MSIHIRFNDKDIHNKLDQLIAGQRLIISQQRIIMSRAEELMAEVATLRTEQQETKDAALAAISRVRELVLGLQAQLEALSAGAVSDAELAEIRAAAAAVKAEADASQAEFAEVAAPAPTPEPEA